MNAVLKVSGDSEEDDTFHSAEDFGGDSSDDSRTSDSEHDHKVTNGNKLQSNENSSDGDLEDESSNDESDKEHDDKKSQESSNDDENAAWADAMCKILKTNKPQKKKSLVLSRAKKISDIKKVKKSGPDFEIVDDKNEDSKEGISIKVEQDDDDGEPKIKKRREDLPNLRVKPNILEKGREKLLSKIATRGVVQLFNAVRKQQKDIEGKIENEGHLERKKEKIIKSLDKHKFLDMLMGQTKSEIVNKELIKKQAEDVKEEESTWSVFKDDLTSGARLKDWDKKETNNDNSSDQDASNSSDSE